MVVCNYGPWIRAETQGGVLLLSGSYVQSLLGGSSESSGAVGQNGRGITIKERMVGSVVSLGFQGVVKVNSNLDKKAKGVPVVVELIDITIVSMQTMQIMREMWAKR
ncbi:hypothetical protein PTKIN_Ptkin03bG0092300 [Pterospermum kingtungense]